MRHLFLILLFVSSALADPPVKPPTAPGQPRLTVQSCAGSATIGITWPPSTPKTFPIQGYELCHWNGKAWVPFLFVNAPTTMATDTAISGAPYYSTVSARDTAGNDSPLSAWSAITPNCPAPSLRLTLTCPASAPIGTDLHIPLTATVGTNALGAYAVTLTYNPAVLHVTGVQGATSGLFTQTPTANVADWTTGSSKFSGYQTSSLTSPSGTVPLGTITFHVVGGSGGVPTIGVTVRSLFNTNGASLGGAVGQGCP